MLVEAAIDPGISWETDSTGITLTMRISEWAVNTSSTHDEPYSIISIDDMPLHDEANRPILPTTGVMLGVPTHEGLTLETVRVVSSDVSLAHPIQLVEAVSVPNLFHDNQTPALELIKPQPSVQYAQPAPLSRIGQAGFLRDQPFVQIEFNPVSYLAESLQATLHTEIVARLSWRSDTVSRQVLRANHPDYEKLLENSLLNAAELKRPAAIAAPSLATNSSLRSRNALTPALRFAVDSSGIYSVTGRQLATAGWDIASISAENIALKHRDSYVPIGVNDGGDNSLDATDAIYFYAEGYEDLYVDKNVYWLEVLPIAAPRFQLVDGTPLQTQYVTTFPDTVHAEEDTHYWRSMPNGANQDHWFWGNRLSPAASGLDSSRDFQLTTNAVANSVAVSATVSVNLRGYTGLSHLTGIYINGELVDTVVWSGQISLTHTVSVAHSLLSGSQTMVTVEALDSGAVVDQIYVNWVKLGYIAQLSAENEVLSFTPPAPTITVSNFISSPLYIFDISNPYSPTQIISTTATQQGATWALALQPPAGAARLFTASPAALLTIDEFTADKPSTLKSGENSADYIIITHADFISAAQRLADYRADQGLRTSVVDVQDVYDEFNAGFFATAPIRDFLQHTYHNWQAPAPTYVVFLGDAYQDFKDDLNSGTRNFVPSHVIESVIYGQVPSDNWFVTFEGNDVLPEMLAGRLSAETATQAHTIVDKIIAYESGASTGTALFVADDNDTTFEAASESIVDTFPLAYTPERVYASAFPPNSPTTAITTSINSGVDFVSYFGHGEYFRWGKWNNESDFIFGTDLVPTLTNSTQLPIVTIGNCLNGFFTSFDSRASLAEVLQRSPNGGAAAVWSATSLGYTSGHKLLLDSFYSSVFSSPSQTLGATAAAAAANTFSQSSTWGEMINTFVIFGDPASNLQISPQAPTSIATATSQQSQLLPYNLVSVAVAFAISLTFIAALYWQSAKNRHLSKWSN